MKIKIEGLIDNGGPAFPDPTFPHSGMTMREWYAGLALQALCSNIDNKLLGYSPQLANDVAAICVAYADALIAVLKANHENQT